jgi:DNA-directed RNA polymerase sigma subunit (sigma70/sigma32)
MIAATKNQKRYSNSRSAFYRLKDSDITKALPQLSKGEAEDGKRVSTISKREYQSIVQYARELESSKTLGIEEESELAERVKCGDAVALKRLIAPYLRKVLGISMKYQHRGLPLCDLVNEGNVA